MRQLSLTALFPTCGMFLLLALCASGCGGGDSGVPTMTGSGGSGATGGNTAASGNNGAGTGGHSGSGGGSSTSVTCDPQAVPLDQNCVSDDYAVFVWGTGKVLAKGSDNNPGIAAAPVATVAKAVEIALLKSKPVIVACGDTLQGAIMLEDIASDLRIVGGYACPDEVATDQKAFVPRDRRADVTSLFSVRNSTGHIVVENFAFKAFADENANFVAGLIEKSHVTLRNVQFAAASANATDPTARNYWSFSKASLDGSDRGSDACSTVCPDGQLSAGGKGEVVTKVDSQDMIASLATAGLPDLGKGAPGKSTSAGVNTISCVLGSTNGGNGADGESGKPGSGAARLGRIEGSKWIPEAGQWATNGKPGQGGGGSGGAADLSGYPGACGGCGGHAGAGGKGGGSSFALLSIDSTLTIEGSTLKAGDGGKGGLGDSGQSGQDGGKSGGQFDPAACRAGDGGKGGSGGPGGGGAGGNSAGVAWFGKAPVLTDTTVTIGERGLRGLGGDPGVNDGVDGLAMETLDLSEQVTASETFCAGKANSCRDVDGSECQNVPFCTFTAGCNAICATITDQDQCKQLDGCEWDHDACIVYGADCTATTEAVCNKSAACHWGSCNGFEETCEGLRSESCELLPGCALTQP